MFVILQKYDFSSKSQQKAEHSHLAHGCLWYCKSTIFQANHNLYLGIILTAVDVCDTAKVRFFKQITTGYLGRAKGRSMFVILQKYDFSSKSQLNALKARRREWCLWYCKSTIFQANHNIKFWISFLQQDVCDTAKVRFFKQITTRCSIILARLWVGKIG